MGGWGGGGDDRRSQLGDSRRSGRSGRASSQGLKLGTKGVRYVGTDSIEEERRRLQELMVIQCCHSLILFSIVYYVNVITNDYVRIPLKV